ncbi:aminotransferase class V-fold PLP-dependent enzyme [Candidatus Poribacteria bacterium]|nr:aminotransferase class V-fold PLP-dependent enzyme [Candidatus Poribacteria bacterium]
MENPDPYYFDYAASTPPFVEAMEMYKSYSLNYSANPSSTHTSGIEANRKLLELKIRFCNLLDFKDGHLLLCSSATEANNTIIEGHRRKFPQGKILIAEDVHDSIWYATRKHKDHTDVIPLAGMDHPSTKKFVNAIQPETSLICINHVCNETGRVYQIAPIAEICFLRNIRLLVDGSQAVGHIPVKLNNIPCDYYSFSAHKFGGPRSVGGLLIRDKQFEPLLSGGKQEWELRAGTENLAGLAATITALEICLSNMDEQATRLNMLKTNLLNELKNQIPVVLINTPEHGLPGFLSLSFPGLLSNEIVTALSISGFEIARGSACHANRIEPSRIILATGRNEKEAAGTIRISMGRGNTEKSVKELGSALSDHFLS